MFSKLIYALDQIRREKRGFLFPFPELPFLYPETGSLPVKLVRHQYFCLMFPCNIGHFSTGRNLMLSFQWNNYATKSLFLYEKVSLYKHTDWFKLIRIQLAGIFKPVHPFLLSYILISVMHLLNWKLIRISIVYFSSICLLINTLSISKYI